MAHRIHDPRRAYGIKLAERGCPMHFISEVMRHHSVDFTRRRCARFSPESASKAVRGVLEHSQEEISTNFALAGDTRANIGQEVCSKLLQ